MYKIIGADANQYGPVSAEQMRQWIKEGRANGQTLVQLEGTIEWKPLAQFPEFGLAPAAGTPPPIGGVGAYPVTPAAQPEIPNYLVYSILSALCCCPAFGIVAIVYSSQVNTKVSAGDYAGAEAASRNARLWCWVSFGVGVGLNIISLISAWSMLSSLLQNGLKQF